MLVKCRQIISGKLLTRQVLPLSKAQVVLDRALSTTRLTANEYDDLYADRWAKFQCKQSKRFG